MYQEFQNGWIEVICGPMFAGKSEELIRRIRTLKFANKNIKCFKPSIDKRYSETEIASHAGGKYEAFAVTSVEEISAYIIELEVAARDALRPLGSSLKINDIKIPKYLLDNEEKIEK